MWSQAPNAETGTLPGGYPYARAGAGPRTLVVLPGFGDAMWSGAYPPGAGLVIGAYFARLLEERAAILVSRPRGLPEGYDVDDAVEGHARALESLDADGPTDVIGISMGGLIGQALARRRPDLVDRLVLANSACRLDDSARDAAGQLERDARERDWFSIRAELARAMFADARAIAYPPLIHTVGRFTLPRPAVPADVWRSLEFVRRFDACDRLEELDRPTLVFGGSDDPYFTPTVTRATADALPDADLLLIPGAKHGAFHERKSTFDARVRSFLER